MALAVLAPLAVAIAQGHGLAPTQVRMSGGAAWLASPAEGVVTLIDGSSEQVIALVAAPKVADLSVVQAGTSAYAVSGIEGTVSRLDGASYRVSAPVKFGAGGAGGVLAVYPGKDTTYVLDAQRAVASVTDSASLAVRERLSLSSQPAPGQSVVDDQGRLWVVSAAGLARFDRSGKHVQPGVGDAKDELVLVRGRATLVDPARSRVAALGDDGTPGSWSCLDLNAGQPAELFGSDALNRVLAAVPGTGELAFAGDGQNDCGHTVSVGNPGDKFGQPAESGSYVFVPNWTSGRTVIVNVDQRAVAGDLPIVKPGNRLELLAKDGLVFYNDLDGDKAGVIHFDGRAWKLGKSLKKFQPGKDGQVVPDAVIPTDAPSPTAPASVGPIPTGLSTTAPSRSTSAPPALVIPPARTQLPPADKPTRTFSTTVPTSGAPPLPPTTTAPATTLTTLPTTTTTTTRPVPTGDPSCGKAPGGFTGNKAKQKIVFPAIKPVVFNRIEDAASNGSACATSGLPVALVLSGSKSGCQLNADADGSFTIVSQSAQVGNVCSVTAKQAGNADFAAAAPVTRVFTVNKDPLKVTWDVAPPADMINDQAMTLRIHVTSFSGARLINTVDVQVDGPCQIDNNTVPLTGNESDDGTPQVAEFTFTAVWGSTDFHPVNGLGHCTIDVTAASTKYAIGDSAPQQSVTVSQN